MKQIFCIVIILILSYLHTFAQQTTFSKIFSNYSLNAENGWKIMEVSTGYLLVSANTCLDNSSENCSSLVLVDYNGDVIWYRTLNQSLGYQASHIMFNENKIYVSGRSNDDDTQFSIYCYDIDGVLLWNKTYGSGSEREWPAGILKFSQGSIFLYGGRDRNQNHIYEWLPVLMKVNLQGDSLTEFTFNEQYDASSVRQVIESTQHDLIASYVYCPDGCFLDLKAGVICLDSVGNTKWVLDLPFSFSSYGCFVSQIDSNTLAVKWHIDSNLPNHDLTPPAIFFTNMSGAIQDTFIFQNQSLKEVHYMESIWEKGLVGSGSNFIDYLTLSNPPWGGWVFRMDENREIVWDRTYLDTIYQGRSFGLNQIIPTSDGGYIATGTITNFMTGVWESHNWILKLDSSGCLQPGCGNLNYITETEEAVFLKGKDIKVYPNPASEYVQVEFPEDFDLGQSSYVVVVSNSGKVIKQEKISAPISQLNLSGITSGMYYLMIRRGNEIIGSKRIIVHH